jgi:hypothetical protein
LKLRQFKIQKLIGLQRTAKHPRSAHLDYQGDKGMRKRLVNA